LAFAARRKFLSARVPTYVTAQIIGGIAAVSFLRAMFGTEGLLDSGNGQRVDAVVIHALESVTNEE